MSKKKGRYIQRFLVTIVNRNEWFYITQDITKCLCGLLFVKTVYTLDYFYIHNTISF